MFKNAGKYFILGAAAASRVFGGDSSGNKQCTTAFCDLGLPPLPYDYKALEPYIGRLLNSLTYCARILSSLNEQVSRHSAFTTTSTTPSM